MPRIRSINENDWNQFQILEFDAFPSDPASKEDFDRWLEFDGFLGLFNDEDILIGYLYCRIHGKYAHLHRIGLLSPERGKGYGSNLFEKAIAYFEGHSILSFSLFVETTNFSAIDLYKKYGLEIIFESWHYILHLEPHISQIISPFKEVITRELQIDDLQTVKSIFPRTNIEELEGMLQEIKSKPTANKFLIMFDKSDLKAIARFNTKYSGCKPFFISDVTYFDTFIDQLLKYKEPDKTYIRITFDDNATLAQLCKERNYVVHHHLYKMTRKI